MSDSTEIEQLEQRAAELHRLFQRADQMAAFHERHEHNDAPTFRRRADAWFADYEAAVRDLHRARETEVAQS